MINKSEISRKLRCLGMCILLMCTMLMMGGCLSNEQKEELKKIEVQAEINAKNYINEKYGFDVEVVNVEGVVNYDGINPNGDITGYANITLKYDGKEFIVYISGEEETSKGTDNYQSDSIYVDMIEEVKSAANINADDIVVEILYGGKSSENIMVNTYYNGENLDVVKQEIESKIDYKIFTLNADLKNYDAEIIKTNLVEFSEILMINCEDTENFENVKKANITKFSMDVDEYVIYIDDYLNIDRRTIEYMNIEKVSYDGFTICMKNGTYCEVTASECNPQDWIGRGFAKEPKQVFGAYSIGSDAEKIYIYVDIDALDIAYSDNVTIATSYVGEEKVCYDNGILTEVIDDKYLTNSEKYKGNLMFTVFKSLD